MTQNSTLGTVSVAAIRQYLRAADHHGIATPPLLRAAGLSETDLRADDDRVDGARFQTFLRHLCDSADDPVFGLRTGDFVEPGSYSVLGYITMSCATLGEAVQRITPYERLVGDMGLTRIEQHGDEVHLVWQCAYTDPVVRAHMTDNVFGSWINYARWLGGESDAGPIRVALERPSPGERWEHTYRQRWGCAVHFEASDNRVVTDAALLSEPLRHPAPSLRRTLEAHARDQMAAIDSDTTLVTRARVAIRHHLLQGVTRQDLIANELGMTSRTLQRRLSQEGVSYQQVLDEVRQSLAEDYLQRTDLPIPDIALRLGFSETTSFHRYFRHRVGTTPGEFRQQATRQDS
ncbi:AraC family transcriptional regulator [Tamilnaduibacter salinus]|uniref:AraC family transcriptional regulator n=1 Tax=Tamilnaduibacter salinus TaxID=1484056 RepID=A0A2U1D1F9_9GAMM|nr:AraC family transcriptional regulator [Tamilnaduibacter salinus]PVY79207.1 AraC family transcriptional regulator [Tamilnaduibacter salinus]